MTPAQVSADIERLSKQALDDVLARIRRGETPRDAIEAALAAFRGPYYALIAQALSEILQASIGVARVKAWPVGGVMLSQRLYAHHRAISLAAASTIAAHLKGPHSARVLAKTLYDGYDFKPDTLKVIKALPKYLRVEFDRAQAARLKTPALRAAYLGAIRKAEAGAGMEELGKRLNVALQERNRFFANRIARTELHRAHTDQQARELMAQERIQYVQYRMSSKHPKVDQCDAMARVDRYGLGPGVFPKAVAPRPPLHPFCLCVLSPMIALDPKLKPKFNPKAERAYLAGLPPEQAARVAGSRDRLQRALDGETLESLYNAGQDDLYKWKRVGDVGQNATMASVATIRRFLVSRAPDPIPVAVLPPDIRNDLGANTDRVLLSRYTADKQRKHPEITADSYVWLQDLIDKGERISDKALHVVVVQHRGEWFVAVLKATKARDEVYLQSFRRSDAKDVAKLRGDRKK